MFRLRVAHVILYVRRVASCPLSAQLARSHPKLDSFLLGCSQKWLFHHDVPHTIRTRPFREDPPLRQPVLPDSSHQLRNFRRSSRRGARLDHHLPLRCIRQLCDGHVDASHSF